MIAAMELVGLAALVLVPYAMDLGRKAARLRMNRRDALWGWCYWSNLDKHGARFVLRLLRDTKKRKAATWAGCIRYYLVKDFPALGKL